MLVSRGVLRHSMVSVMPSCSPRVAGTATTRRLRPRRCCASSYAPASAAVASTTRPRTRRRRSSPRGPTRRRRHRRSPSRCPIAPASAPRSASRSTRRSRSRRSALVAGAVGRGRCCTTTMPRASPRTRRISARGPQPLEVYAGDGSLAVALVDDCRPHPARPLCRRPHADRRRGRRALSHRRAQRHHRAVRGRRVGRWPRCRSTASPPIRTAAATSSTRTTRSSSTASAPRTPMSPRSGSARSPTRTPRRPRAIATSASSGSRSSASAARCGHRPSSAAATPPNPFPARGYAVPPPH